MGHSNNVIFKGFYWNAIQLVINQFFSFAVRLILARLLFPEQFGLVGMAIVFIGFVQKINEMGITSALIQRKEELMTPQHYYTSFWTGLLWSFILFIIMTVAVAPFGAWFYEESKLEEIIIVMSISFLFTPFSIINKAILTRAMNFKLIAKVENLASFISGVISISLAFAGAGIWALVFQSVAVGVILVPLYFKVSDWRPKLIWEKKAFHDIFGFGMFTSLTNLINYLKNNVDYLLIGKLVNANALGAYTFAFILTDAVKNRIAAVISTVMYPVYSSLQSDKEKSIEMYNKVVEYNCILIYPIMLVLLLFGEPLILEFFGNKWAESVFPAQILSLAVMLQLLVFSDSILIRGLGYAKVEFRLQLIKTLIYVPIIVIGIYMNGIIGAAFGVLINRFIAIIITFITFRMFDFKYGLRDFLASIKTPFLASMISVLLALGFYKYINTHYLISIVILILAYLMFIYINKRKELVIFIQALKNK